MDPAGLFTPRPHHPFLKPLSGGGTPSRPSSEPGLYDPHQVNHYCPHQAQRSPAFSNTGGWRAGQPGLGSTPWPASLSLDVPHIPDPSPGSHTEALPLPSPTLEPRGGRGLWGKTLGALDDSPAQNRACLVCFIMFKILLPGTKLYK